MSPSQTSLNSPSIHCIGRSTEIAVFRALLKSDAANAELTEPVRALYIYGPGGTGKTTILRECTRLCEDFGVPFAQIDARDIEPSISGMLERLAGVLGCDSNQDVLQVLQKYQKKLVIFLDTFELLQALDAWFREQVLPKIPAGVTLVLSGRATPSVSWKTSPSWRSRVRPLALRNLDPDDSRQYLRLREVPEEQHESVLKFTHGHPLALALVADAFAQQSDLIFEPQQTPDIIQALLEQFLEDTPDAAHRAALEACAMVRSTTESLLAALLDEADVRELFDWLRSLTFVEAGPAGLFPHDLAREALVADLRWRNPERYAELHGRARRFYMQRLKQSGSGRQLALFDFIFLHRENPVIRSNFDWTTAGALRQDVMRAADLPAVLEMLEQHEGPQSVELAKHWYERQAQNFYVYRDADGRPCGLLTVLVLTAADSAENETDPASRAALSYLENSAPLRAGETATLFRFWMDSHEYQKPSPAQSAIFASFLRHYLTAPHLAISFLPCADPEFWTEGFRAADKIRFEDLDFELNGVRYGMFGHDWRVRTPAAWVELMAQQELAGGRGVAPGLQAPPIVVLSRLDFHNAVRAALRSLHSLSELHSNPLLQSRVVTEQLSTSADITAKAALLQSLISELAEEMQNTLRDEQVSRTLHMTYINPVGTQEDVAEVLNLAFSTYRRRLRKGIEHLTELLWQREIA